MFRREQWLAIRIVVTVAAILLLVGMPLVLSSELRLRVAHELGLAPGEDVPQIAEADETIDLLVAPVTRRDPTTGRDVRSLVSLYVARSGAGGVLLEDLNGGREVRLPISSYDHVAASPDAGSVLFVKGDTSNTPEALLVTVATGEVTPLPAGQRRPDLPGDWESPLWENVSVRCSAASPDLTYIACLDPPEAAHYLAGDWELRVQRYGEFRTQEPIYRGRGFLPIAGWTLDERSLYFHNEFGIWRADIDPGMFTES